MALNIPVNLMAVTVPQHASIIDAATPDIAGKPSDAVAAARPGADTSTAFQERHPNSESGSHATALQRTALTQAASTQLNRAEPTSVIIAKAKDASDHSYSALQPSPNSQELTKAGISPLTDPPRKVDRYAPPDPLPTAPILKRPAQVVAKLADD